MKKKLNKKIIIGVLALQGSFTEHVTALKKLKIETLLIKEAQHIDSVDGLIIPGGESTAILKLMNENKITHILRKYILNGLPVWGTCAGAILLAKKVTGLNKATLGVIDIEIIRNAYGRQNDSFKESVRIPKIQENQFPGIFIRSPKIIKIAKDIAIFGKIRNKEIVGVEHGNILATTFHPELSNNLRIHQYFIDKIKS